MKATIREPEILESIAPRNIEFYLSAHGWTEAERRPDRFSIWAHSDGKARVLVPVRQDFVDYPVRVSELLAMLAEVEQRSQVAIAGDLRRVLADTIRVARDTQGMDDDSIPLDAGAALVGNARNLVLAAACAAVAPRPLYPTRKPDLAEKFIRRVRMGHTEPGSYVVTIIAPIVTTLPMFDSFATEPFERRATRTLIESVDLATKAALECERSSSLEPLISTVSSGVSANLLDALAGLNDDTDAARVHLRVSWAVGSGLSLPSTSQVTLLHRVAPIFRQASETLKAEAPLDDVQIQGFITDLHRDLRLMRDSPSAGGVVSMATQIEGIPRKVNVELPLEDYQKAAAAHTQGAVVQMSGDLRRDGRSFVLERPHSIVFFG